MKHEEYIRRIPGADTAVLCIHGILGTPNHFRDFISLIPQEWSVYNLLLDGHGKGVGDFSASSMKKWQAQVAARMTELDARYERVIILAHSMGTLLALKSSLEYSDKIKAMFLLAVPLKAGVSASYLMGSLKLVFNREPPDDARLAAERAATSIHLERGLWRYLGWVPRYLELFRLIKEVRGLIPQITVPCQAFQSAHDELVALVSYDYLRQNPEIDARILPQSYHSYYHPDDRAVLLDQFRALVDRFKN